MSAEYLDIPFDIHTGGVDLLFPHHENEIAQTCGATGEDLARWWLHNEHLLLEGRKMSKSLGNHVTLRELIEEGHDPVTIRYHLLATHYRQQLNFRREGLKAAAASIARVREAARLWRERSLSDREEEVLRGEAEATAVTAREAFTAAMDADLNISEGLSALFELVRAGNALLEQGVGPAGAALLLETLEDLDRVFALLEDASGGDGLSREEEALIQAREQARSDRDWAEADRLRDELLAAGIVVEDTPEGPRWKRTDG
jgi:cysteinyl-tRNA synthetase